MSIQNIKELNKAANELIADVKGHRNVIERLNYSIEHYTKRINEREEVLRFLSVNLTADEVYSAVVRNFGAAGLKTLSGVTVSTEEGPLTLEVLRGKPVLKVDGQTWDGAHLNGKRLVEITVKALNKPDRKELRSVQAVRDYIINEIKNQFVF